MSFDSTTNAQRDPLIRSQSLWNRAMSFDIGSHETAWCLRLNPFGTGQCLSTDGFTTWFSISVRLNPFGTGQCLSTEHLQVLPI